MSSRLRLFGLLVFLGTLLVFSRSLEHGFLNYDDPEYVTENALVRDGLGWAGVQRAFTTPVMANYHPVTMLSYMLDWQLSGGDPALFHLTSVFWHACNAVLVLLLFRALGVSDPVAFFAAALFAWHPLRVESVAWIAERKDVLSGFFFLLTLLCYLRYAGRKVGTGSRWSWYAASMGCFVVGLLCKPMLVTLPGVLLLVDFLQWSRVSASGAGATGSLVRFGPVVRAVVEKLPFIAVSLLFAWIAMVTQRGAGAVSEARELGSRLGTAVAAVGQYAGKTFWPVDLVPLYPVPLQTPRLWLVAGLLLLVGGAALGTWQWRRRPWVAVGGLWFAGMLVPVLGLVQIGFQSMADRYTYLPGLGLLLIAAFGVEELGSMLASRGARVGAAVAAVLVTAAVLQTVVQIDRWRSPITLWEHTLSRTTGNAMAHFSLGNAYFDAGRLEEAEREYRRALALVPALHLARTNLAVTLASRGRGAEALRELELAEAAGATDPKLFLNMARMLIAIGRYQDAVAKCEVALTHAPGLPAAERLMAEARAGLARAKTGAD